MATIIVFDPFAGLPKASGFLPLRLCAFAGPRLGTDDLPTLRLQLAIQPLFEFRNVFRVSLLGCIASASRKWRDRAIRKELRQAIAWRDRATRKELLMRS